MNKNIIGVIVSIIYIGIILLTSKLVEKKGEEASRKYIHIMLSNYWIIVVMFFDSILYASILPAVFVVINSISYKFNLIKSMEREKNDGLGTVYYAISLLILSIFTMYIKNPIIGLSGVLVMGYGDGFAAILGKKIKSKEFKVFGSTKTVAGSITMLIISLIIIIPVFMYLKIDMFVLKAIITAILATILEFVSIKGLDNITVPVVVSVLTYIFSL